MAQLHKQGQIGLILLVLMGVVIALALSLASRSLSDTVLSRQEQESSTAFRLAETGVEQAMNLIRQDDLESVPLQPLTSGIFSSSYDINTLSSYALYVKEGEQAHLDLTGYNVGNPLTVQWTRRADSVENPSGCSEGSGNAPAALEFVAIQGGSSTATYSYYNPNCNMTSPNGFEDSQEGNTTYLSSISYTAPLGTTMLRLRPLYSDATISATGNGLSTQLYLIQSEAQGGDAKKEIEVKRGLDAPPSVFDFALFSGGTIVK